MQELKGALAGARIGSGEAEIAIDNACKGQLREIVPLGYKLRADDDVMRAFCNLSEEPPKLNRALNEVA
jgi:hypothetical protein